MMNKGTQSYGVKRMVNLSWQFLKRVDYGEQELCAEQSLLQGSEYLEYLSSEAPFCPTMSQDSKTEIR